MAMGVSASSLPKLLQVYLRYQFQQPFTNTATKPVPELISVEGCSEYSLITCTRTNHYGKECIVKWMKTLQANQYI